MKKQKTIDELVSDLIQSYDDELQTLTNKELEKEYEKRFGREAEIVAK